MAIYKQEQVQRGAQLRHRRRGGLHPHRRGPYPLIISGKGDDSSKLYEMTDFLVSRMKKQVFAKTDSKEAMDDLDCDYIVDEKERTVSLTAKGIKKVEEFFQIEKTCPTSRTPPFPTTSTRP